MPLIIITGYPTSGKTYRARQLYDYFVSRTTTSAPPSNTEESQSATTPPSQPQPNLRIHLITDHSLSISRSVYNLSSKKTQHDRSANSSEKDARATLYAAVKRVLSPRDVVIVDGAGGNYIKGWRYQLHCEAKAVRTSCCCVHVGTSREGAKEINEGRLARVKAREERGKLAAEEEKDLVEGDDEDNDDEENKPYDAETWENLVFRYEEPNAMARWDSPLFTVLYEDSEPPFEAIWDALIGSPNAKVVVRPNQATVARAQSSEGYLYELDKVTQGLLNQILQWSKDHPGEGGGEVSVGEAGSELVVELPANVVGLPQLQRLRRQFIGLNRQNAVPVERIRAGFVGFLNDSFESG